MNRRKTKLTLRKIITDSIMFFLAIFLLYALLFFFFADEIRAASEWAVDTLGYAGVFAFVLLVDTFIVPASGDLVFPFTFGWNIPLLLAVMSSASILGGFLGFCIARRLSHVRRIQETVRYYRERGDFLIRKYGAWAIVIAGLTPVPYSTISWIAGLANFPARLYLLASLSRIPRFILYYLAIQAGIILLS